MKQLVVYVLSLVTAILVVLTLYHGVIRDNTSLAIRPLQSVESPTWPRSKQEVTRPLQSVESSTPPRSKQDVTYVTVSKYLGQQGAGARDIAALQCFLMSLQKSMNHSFVLMEPYFKDNQFAGSPNTTLTDALKFSDIFNMDYFNTVSRETGRTEMVTQEEFMAMGPAYTILIKPIVKPDGEAAILWKSDVANPECLNGEKMHELEHSFGKMDPKICVVQVVALPFNMADRQESPVKIRDIRDSIFKEWPPQKVTLIIGWWGGYYYMPLESGLTCARELRSNITKLLFKPSKRLQHDAKRYEEMFLDNQHKLAIMLRVEHVIKVYLNGNQKDPNGPNSLEDCFKEVLNISNTLQGPTQVYPFVTMDIGQFGTKSFHTVNTDVTKLSKQTFQALYHDKWSVKGWEESFVTVTGGVKDAAYIAALQRTLASRADCLILVGGGNFQSLALEDYLDYHNQPCVHVVCSRHKLLNSILQNMQHA